MYCLAQQHTIFSPTGSFCALDNYLSWNCNPWEYLFHRKVSKNFPIQDWGVKSPNFDTLIQYNKKLPKGGNAGPLAV